MSPKSDGARNGFEPWARVAFALAAATVALFVVLGFRPGSPLGPFLYTKGALALGLSSVALLAIALGWSVSHRPVLGRRRLLPLLLLGGCVVASSLPIPYPSSHAKRWSTVPFRLPFEGAWRVLWGGARRSENALILSPSRRFGFEFVPIVEESGEGAILAPADGRVVGLEAGHPDGAGKRPPFGNHVVLEVAPGEFLILANLRAGSLEVKTGQSVRAGDRLGAPGDSAGASRGTRPRLMVHLQDTPVAGEGEGIPMRFRGYEVDGRQVAAGVPVGGWRGGAPAGEIVRVPRPR